MKRDPKAKTLHSVQLEKKHHLVYGKEGHLRIPHFFLWFPLNGLSGKCSFFLLFSRLGVLLHLELRKLALLVISTLQSFNSPVNKTFNSYHFIPYSFWIGFSVQY